MFCKHRVSFMLFSAKKPDPFSVRTFLGPREDTVFMAHSVFLHAEMAGRVVVALGVFNQKDPGLSLTKRSLCFSICCLFFDFSCLPLR